MSIDLDLKAVSTADGWRLDGGGPLVEAANGYLSHLGSRALSPATVRAYAFDLLNFGRFLADRELGPAAVAPSDLFDYLDWQTQRLGSGDGGKVVRLCDRKGAAPATMNRRIAAVRGLFEYMVMSGDLDDNPVPTARRSSGLRASSPTLNYPRDMW